MPPNVGHFAKGLAARRALVRFVLWVLVDLVLLQVLVRLELPTTFVAIFI